MVLAFVGPENPDLEIRQTGKFSKCNLLDGNFLVFVELTVDALVGQMTISF